MNKLCFGKNIVTRSLFSLFFDNISTTWNTCMPVTEGTSEDNSKSVTQKVTSHFTCSEFQKVCQS